MANTLFIKFKSLPLFTGDNISFKYNGGAKTATIVFGSGGDKCPVATTVTQQASNLVTFISDKYPDLIALPSTPDDTMQVIALDGSNITNPLQPNLAPTTPEVVYEYTTTNQDPPSINSTSGTLPTTLGTGTRIRMNCYWRSYYKYKPGVKSCRDSEKANSPAEMGTDAAPIVYISPQDYASTSTCFNEIVFPGTSFKAFANVAFSQYSIDTGTNKFKFKMNGETDRNGQCATTYVQQAVKIRITRKAPGGTFASFILTGEDFRSGEAVQILLNTPEKVALFLSTDFLDLGGINNQVAYNNPVLMNYDDNTTTPTAGSNTTVLLCKSAITGDNPINAYEFGHGSDLAWTWWNRSFLVRDSSATENIYGEILYLLNQNVITGTKEPGTKAIDS